MTPARASEAPAEVAQVAEEVFRFLPFDWQSVSGVADSMMVVLNLILVVSVFYAYRTFRSSEQARTTDILIWAINQMEEIKPDIATVRLIRRPVDAWSAKQKQAAARVSIRLQRLAYMARAGLIEASHFRAMWAITFVDMWDRLAPWIQEVRGSHGEPLTAAAGAFSRVDFELLSLEYRTFVDEMRAKGASSKVNGELALDLQSDL